MEDLSVLLIKLCQLTITLSVLISGGTSGSSPVSRLASYGEKIQLSTYRNRMKNIDIKQGFSHHLSKLIFQQC